jgi:hypothetical protein
MKTKIGETDFPWAGETERQDTPFSQMLQSARWQGLQQFFGNVSFQVVNSIRFDFKHPALRPSAHQGNWQPQHNYNFRENHRFQAGNWFPD